MSPAREEETMRVRPPSASILAGVARADITPPVGIYARMWGAAAHDVAAGVHRPLCLTALAIKSAADDEPLLLVSMDVGWWQRSEDEWFVRSVLFESLDIDPSRVMLSATHTHASASLCLEDADKPGGHLIEGYLQKIRQGLITAAQEAIEKLAPATMTFSAGRCELATNRDLSEPDSGRMICGFNPKSTADDTVTVGRVTDASGNILAVVVNYACHATTLAWENQLLSPDYIGAMRETVESHVGGLCLFLQGASGELSPMEQYTGDPDIADANGRQLGHAVLSTLSAMLPPRTQLTYAGPVESGAVLARWQREVFKPMGGVFASRMHVPLPLKPMPTEEELVNDLNTCSDRVMAERLRRKIRVVRIVGSGSTCEMPVWVWRVGEIIFVGQQNEAYSSFQMALRQRFPDVAIVVMNLVNGACGYLSPPELHDLDIYQVWQSPFERGALPVMIEACAQEIERLLTEG